MGEELELCTLVYGEPVEVSQVRGHKGLAWEVKDESGHCVLDSL